MTNDKVCQTIHSARQDAGGKALCVHRWEALKKTYHNHREETIGDVVVKGYLWVCTECKLRGFPKDFPIPSYTTDHRAYMEMMAEMQEREWWADFCYWFVNHGQVGVYFLDAPGRAISKLLNTHSGSHALAEWLEDNREVWGNEKEER